MECRAHHIDGGGFDSFVRPLVVTVLWKGSTNQRDSSGRCPGSSHSGRSQQTFQKSRSHRSRPINAYRYVKFMFLLFVNGIAVLLQRIFLAKT